MEALADRVADIPACAQFSLCLGGDRIAGDTTASALPSSIPCPALSALPRTRVHHIRDTGFLRVQLPQSSAWRRKISGLYNRNPGCGVYHLRSRMGRHMGPSMADGAHPGLGSKDYVSSGQEECNNWR